MARENDLLGWLDLDPYNVGNQIRIGYGSKKIGFQLLFYFFFNF